MFGLFGKKTYRPSVTPEDKDWIEKNMSWFIEVFGLDRLKQQPFILPIPENFPYTNLKDTGQFHQLFEQLCKYWDLNSNEIIVQFFDDLRSKQWENLIPQGPSNSANGIYNKIYTTGEKRYRIQLAKSNLEHPQLLVSVIAHELAHVKLLGGNYINRNDTDLEPMTDLASIFFGFGIFVANSVQTRDIYWISRSGYLPNQLISYSNALLCYITNHDAGSYLSHLNKNTNELFKKDFEFLIKTNETILTKENVADTEAIHRLGKQVTEGFEKRQFADVIEASQKLLKQNGKNIGAFNNIGYALLLQKKYTEAIDAFTRAIDIDPYWDYPYNNRGYCKLQLGDIQNSFADLQSSFEMNPDNSFSWRNLGAYYLHTGEFEKALEHFGNAEKIDPKTELINFYLGHACQKTGKHEQAKVYFKKSVELNEYNDSILE